MTDRLIDQARPLGNDQEMAQARILAMGQATDQAWPLDRNQEMAQFQVKTIDTEHLMIHTIHIGERSILFNIIFLY